MRLDELRQHWQAFGEQDPLWAILTAPGKRGGAWDIEEFLATGRDDVEFAMRMLEERGVVVARRRALDFGCGVGRLTHALANDFERCDGVDLAGSMIARANVLNPDPERVHFYENKTSDLRLFETGSIDFVLSLLVLQHMEPTLICAYLSEIVRVLGPGGVAYFNLPQPVVGKPLPPEAWKMSVQLAAGLPDFSSTRCQTVPVIVRNDSTVLWPASAHLRLGNHWRTVDRELLTVDDGRTPIEGDVAPGQEVRLELEVMAPAVPGPYVLEIDLVQENVNWFSDRGSPTLCLPVNAPEPVTEGAEAEGGPSRSADRVPFAPRMEMYALEPSIVSRTMEAAGAKVAAAIPADRCGPWHPSLDYIVVRQASRKRWSARRLIDQVTNAARH